MITLYLIIFKIQMAVSRWHMITHAHYKTWRKTYSHAKLHQVDLYQELSEGCNDVVLISNAKRMDNHSQSQHLDEEVCQKGLQLDWMIGPQGPQTGILSPEWIFQKKKNKGKSRVWRKKPKKQKASAVKQWKPLL